MGIATMLTGLLIAGAGLMAKGVTGEFAKGTGKAAFEAIKARLAGQHGVASFGLMEKAKDNPAIAGAVNAELAAPAIAEDAELLDLARTLRDAITALPESETAGYAVETPSSMARKCFSLRAIY